MTGNRSGFAYALSIVAMALLVLSGMSVLGGEADFKEEGTDNHPVMITVGDVSTITIGKPDSRRCIFWNDDEVFMAVVRNDTPGHYYAFLYHSSDGGRAWDEPVEVMNRSDIFLMRASLHISNGTLFYLVFEAVSYRDPMDLPSRSLHCYVIGTDQWEDIGQVTPQRVDDEVQGYMPSYQLLEFKGDIYVFWVRSHYMDALYRKCSGGVWGPTNFLDMGSYVSEFSAVRSNVSGTEMIHYAYLYHVSGELYVMGSKDGQNWSKTSKVWSNKDSFERISMTEWKGRLHLIVSELEGYDIYHSWSTDGSSWVPFMKIGENTLNDLRSMDPQTNTVGIAGNEDIDCLLVAFDSNSGVELMGSRNNGESFERMARFKNDTAFYPSFCSEGKFLVYATIENELVVRKLGWDGSGLPPDDEDPVDPPNPPDDNSTDPTDPPDDNSTSPPDNGTDDGPVDNGTAPPPDNDTTDPGNGTDDEGNDIEPDPPQSQNNPPDRPKIIFMEGDFYEGVEISIRGSGHDPDENDTELNYTWSIEGMGMVGYGPSLKFTLPAGTYNLTLRVTDAQGAYSEMDYVLVVKSLDGEAGSSNARTMTGLIVLSLVVVQILILSSLAVFLLRKAFRGRRGGEEAPGSLFEPPEASLPAPGGGLDPLEVHAPPEPGSDLISYLAEPTPIDPNDGVRRGRLRYGHPYVPEAPVPPEHLSEYMEAVEERGVRGLSELSALKMKAALKLERGEVPQNVYQDIIEILDQHGD